MLGRKALQGDDTAPLQLQEGHVIGDQLPEAVRQVGLPGQVVPASSWRARPLPSRACLSRRGAPGLGGAAAAPRLAGARVQRLLRGWRGARVQRLLRDWRGARVQRPLRGWLKAARLQRRLRCWLEAALLVLYSYVRLYSLSFVISKCSPPFICIASASPLFLAFRLQAFN